LALDLGYAMETVPRFVPVSFTLSSGVESPFSWRSSRAYSLIVR